MSHEKYMELVKKLEESSRSNPKGYKWKIIGLVSIGFAYVAGILLLLLALALTLLLTMFKHPLLLIKLGIPIGGLIWVILKSFNIKFEPPEGIELTRDSAPELFREIDDLGKSLRAIKIHKVLLTSEFNASVVQIPQAGVLGMHHNYLMIGLPLMQALTPAQFRAVLAHEMGHLSRSHSKFGGWIYRLRRVWGQLMEQFEESGRSGQFLFRRFLRSYSPRLNAYTFVLARENEYEADRLAAKAAGSRNMADALIQLSVRESQLNEFFWPEVNKLPRSQNRPPKVFTDMKVFLDRPAGSPEHANRALKHALRAETSYDDTHPSLAERLQALGEDMRLPEYEERSAAENYLASSLASLMNQLDHQWQEEVESNWSERAEQYDAMREELDKLRTERPDELSEQQVWQLARITEELHGPSDALPLYEALIQRNDKLAPAYMAAGTILIRESNAANDEKARTYISRAMELDSDYTFACCDELIAHYEKRGDDAKAQEWLEIGRNHARLHGLAVQERETIQPTDEYEPHGLEDYQLVPFINELQRYPILKEAYLVRKKVKYWLDKPLYVLLIRNKRKWLTGKRKIAELVVRNLGQDEALLPGTAIVVLNTHRKFRRVRDQAQRHPEGCLFQRYSVLERVSPIRIYKDVVAKRLMRAIDLRKAGAVRMWLALGADPNGLTDNMLPLSLAAHENDIATMNALLRAGAQVNGINSDGNTPLFWAAYQGHEEAVGWLLKQGADPNVRYVSGRSVLSPVCMHGYENILKLLLAAGAKPIYTCHADGETPLMIAAYNGRYECAEILIEAGADPSTKDNHGNTALSFAKQYGHERIVELLQPCVAAG
ncbi:ankyrin repeat domain-containing protein [Cohnella soli]|uniref:Ankyrin repeat domain-containing protein n=1 Tax=Cohnella soli TaxID=425005 RepID=A0ABW0HLK4_9BACL